MSRRFLYTSECPMYQIDYSDSASGKHISATKRNIHWSFGFSSPTAIRSKQSGNKCRGDEYDIKLIWSVTSGKRQLLLNGKEIHFSTKKNSTRFEFSWIMDAHFFQVVGHAAPQLNRDVGSRQFDLLLDGMSFFQFPRIFELGGDGGECEPTSGDRGSCGISREIQCTKTSSHPPAVVDDTIDPFTHGIDAPSSSSQHLQMEDLLDKMTPDNDFLDRPDLSPEMLTPTSFSSSTEGDNRIETATPELYHSFAPLSNQPPSYEYISNEIMHSYSDADSALNNGTTVMVPFYNNRSPSSTLNHPQTAPHIHYDFSQPTPPLHAWSAKNNTHEFEKHARLVSPSNSFQYSASTSSINMSLSTMSTTFSFETFDEENHHKQQLNDHQSSPLSSPPSSNKSHDNRDRQIVVASTTTNQADPTTITSSVYDLMEKLVNLDDICSSSPFASVLSSSSYSKQPNTTSTPTGSRGIPPKVAAAATLEDMQAARSSTTNGMMM